jgi:hypothetical protein
LQTDLIGKLYRTFDTYDANGTIPNELEGWLNDKGMLAPGKSKPASIFGTSRGTEPGIIAGKQNLPTVRAQESGAGDFIEYLDGLDGDELYRLAGAVLIRSTQNPTFGRNETIASVLTQKGLLAPVPLHLPHGKLPSAMQIPYMIPNPVWRYLNENKRWLLNRTIERNQARQDRLDALSAVSLEDEDKRG